MKKKKGQQLRNMPLCAKSVWRAHPYETKALQIRKYIDELLSVDEIWNRLGEKYGNVLAVEAPHACPPESFTYSELATIISDAAIAFSSFGIKVGDVVALYAENSPRWLIADQGLMRAGGCNAVRGASAPIEELRYILNDAESVALIIQSAQLWSELSLDDDQKKSLKFVLIS